MDCFKHTVILRSKATKDLLHHTVKVRGELFGRSLTTFGMTTLLLLSLLLTSCGFHPRGQTIFAKPLQRIYIKTASPYGELTTNLEKYFKSSGVYIADSPQDATTVLQILSDTTNQQLLGVSGTQQTRQYNLILSVAFQITEPNGTLITSPETLSQSRTLPINSGQILGGSNEAIVLFQQMRRTIVFDMMNRISSQQITDIINKHNKQP